MPVAAIHNLTVVDLHRFRSGLLRAILAIKETGYGSYTRRRVQAGCGSHCAHQWYDTGQVASDLGVWHSTLGKWVRAFSGESKVPAQDAELLRENERLRKENRILREEREVPRKAAMFSAAQKP
jgi:transposase